MDEIVKAALKKWPNVPHCTGWLALDARGDWYMRDARVQAAGPFPQVKGSRIEHPMLKAFIERNYEVAQDGCWFFQNGPQRVYVELEATPLVLRVADAEQGFALSTHHGREAQALSTWLDEHDRLYAQTALGLGLVHSLDIGHAADAIEAGRWPPPQRIASGDLPQRFGFVRSPVESLGGPSS